MLLSKLIADVISRKKPAGAGRFVYICDCLRDHAGHFSVIAGSMIRGMRALNVETRVYSHRDILSDLKKELDATGIFSVWPYVVTSTDPLCGSIKTYFDKSRNFELEVAGITELSGNDMVFVDTAMPFSISGTVNWLQKRFAPTDCPRVFFNLLENHGATVRYGTNGIPELDLMTPNSSLYEQFAVTPAFYRYATTLIKSAYAEHFSFSVHTKGTFQDVYAAILKRDVVCTPHPMAAALASAKAPPRGEIIIGCLGYQRQGKGFHFLAPLISSLSGEFGSVRFIVQDSSGNPEITQVISEMERQWPGRIEGIARRLDPHEWASMLGRCDIIVAPYDGPMYTACPSGIVLDAISSGIPAVTMAGTASQYILEEFGMPAVLAEECTAKSVISATRKLIGDYGSYFARAQAARRMWGERNGPANWARAALELYCR